MLVRTELWLGRCRFLVAATFGLSLVHCGDGEMGSTDPLLADDSSVVEDKSVRALDLTGNWGMFLFEDPVAVRIHQEGDVLTGVGCCIPDAAAEQYCCGPITGNVAGDRATFSFPLGRLGDRYRAEVIASDDFMRLGGSFFRDDASDTPLVSMKTAWLRYGFDQETWLTIHPDLESELRSLSGSVLRLNEASESGDGYAHGEGYQLLTAFGSVGGDLGAFWGSELRVRESDGAIVAGPVPVTDPTLPQALVLLRDGTRLLEAEVTMASGASYRFDVVSPAEP
ncbi:MAG TPA: hypothetical protein VI197_11675 [Polyangiaceae bacterium]